MQYQITSDNIEISDSMKSLAIEKFKKIEKRLTEKEEEEALARIVLNQSSADDEFRVKIELSYSGKKYFASEKDFKLETALIKTVEEVERMRRKDDISYFEDWKERRKIKRQLSEEMIENELEDEDGFDVGD
jgi:ribosome-associated translation inhibitor RaiA